MKPGMFILAAISLLALVGCETTPETSSSQVHVGMTSDRLRARFGEPLRIEQVTGGGEDWYYRFAEWRTRTYGETGIVVGNGGTESYVSTTLEPAKEAVERPIHLSPEGLVIEPIPRGKITP